MTILFKSVWTLKSAELMTCNMMPQGGSNVEIKKTNEEDNFRVL